MSNTVCKKVKLLKHSSKNNNIISFVEQLTGIKYYGHLWKYLKDGIVLCVLINKIKQDSILKINKSRNQFKELENIMAYIQACKRYNIPSEDLFHPLDLYNKTINYSDKVLNNLRSIQNLYNRTLLEKHTIQYTCTM